MIGWLRGRLIDHVAEGEVLVDVGGVGYRVTVPVPLRGRLANGSEVELHVHTHVREDALVLFGFASAAERRCFEVLLGTHGVGPSLALSVLGVLGADGLARAVAEEDLGALSAVPGVGRKTAARLVLELQQRLGVPGLADAGHAAVAGDGDGLPARGEVRAALAELGYGPDEVRLAMAELGDHQGPVEELLRRALRQLAGAR